MEGHGHPPLIALSHLHSSNHPLLTSSSSTCTSMPSPPRSSRKTLDTDSPDVKLKKDLARERNRIHKQSSRQRQRESQLQTATVAHHASSPVVLPFLRGTQADSGPAVYSHRISQPVTVVAEQLPLVPYATLYPDAPPTGQQALQRALASAALQMAIEAASRTIQAQQPTEILTAASRPTSAATSSTDATQVEKEACALDSSSQPISVTSTPVLRNEPVMPTVPHTTLPPNILKALEVLNAHGITGRSAPPTPPATEVGHTPTPTTSPERLSRPTGPCPSPSTAPYWSTVLAPIQPQHRQPVEDRPQYILPRVANMPPAVLEPNTCTTLDQMHKIMPFPNCSLFEALTRHKAAVDAVHARFDTYST
ncbi:hypothetical protein BCR37DRAFT_317582 [Protomyces lactucae-debilis]|uniref:Uncharacterized protein n=1 Tax=Protomyces lactucae-debilis TaxID=2754530 RepID=A0A1Y2FFD2_PROLT|nr:uncharacterized protein BCR37DRAFT_317582 [Protomyces lactucae-debilis]ORY82629.1 hypothetical protein BCR37DRAFT_317582 [Protomyces lactucae-debilis]